MTTLPRIHLALAMLVACSLAATPASAAGSFTLAESPAVGCAGPGECVRVDVTIAPAAEASLFDLHVAWESSYWSLESITLNAGLDFSGTDQAPMDPWAFVFGDVGTGTPLPAGATLFTLLLEKTGAGAPGLPILQVGALEALDGIPPFFDQAAAVGNASLAVEPIENAVLLPEPVPHVGVLFGAALLAALRRRARRGGRSIRFALLAALLVLSATLLSFDTAEIIVGQRTFLWHSGDASSSPFPRNVANPFRGRFSPNVAVDRPIFGTDPLFGPLNQDYVPSPSGTRFFEDDFDDALPDELLANPGRRLDPLAPFVDKIAFAPSTVTTALAGTPLSDYFPRFGSTLFKATTPLGPTAALLNRFFGGFGGDFSHQVVCGDPVTNPGVGYWQLNLVGEAEFCVPRSADGGFPPGDPLVTEQENVAIIGGTLENPFRPAPDLSVASVGENDGTLAQGLFIPTRGMRLGQSMQFERNVDPATGRPLVARVGSETVGVCGNPPTELDQVGPDPLLAADPSDPANHYKTTYASHPLSVTPAGSVATVANVLPTFVHYRGGLGRDLECLRPGGAPGDVGAFSRPGDPSRTTDSYIAGATEVIVPLADTNALQNHHANQSLFAALCAATQPFAPLLDPSACAFTLLSSSNGIPLSEDRFSEFLGGVLAGEQSGTGSQGFLQVVVQSTKPAAATSGVFVPVPLASINMLFNDPSSPFDTNDDAVVQGPGSPGCSGQLPGGPCDLGGFDGIDGRSLFMRTRTDASYAAFVTLDRGLTNEQRSQLGCGPFWGTRCDSSINGPLLDPGRNILSSTRGSLWYSRSGGLDPLNGEASAWFETFTDPTSTTAVTSTSPQPGTVGFAGSPVCMRMVGATPQRLPGCRGVQSVTIGAGPVINVEYEADYMPSVDGCVIGTYVVSPTYGVVPVSTIGASQALLNELALCDSAVVRKPVPGVPNAPGPDVCADGSQSVGVPGTSVCDADSVTLPHHPLIHPLAGCEASLHADPGGGCSHWFDRNLVDELINGNGDGTAQLFRSELAAFSWNLQTLLALISCEQNVPDANGATPDIQNDDACYDPATPYATSRCSVAAPQYCEKVVAYLGFAPPIDATGSTGDDDGDGVAADGDGSGVAGDNVCHSRSWGCDDNCDEVVNTGQINSNGGLAATPDDLGNVCDPDLDNDGVVTAADRTLQQDCFLDSTPPGFDCADADLVGPALDYDTDPALLPYDAPPRATVEGFDRLQLLRWLSSGTPPGQAPPL